MGQLVNGLLTQDIDRSIDGRMGTPETIITYQLHNVWC